MDAKHTPGPWIISRKYVVGPLDESDSQGFGMVIGVADVYGDNRNQDGRLIAAAPDMLAALKAQEVADEALEEQLGYDKWQLLEDTAKALRFAAISKAEGK